MGRLLLQTPLRLALAARESGLGRLLSVTNAIKAGTCCQGERFGALTVGYKRH